MARRAAGANEPRGSSSCCTGVRRSSFLSRIDLLVGGVQLGLKLGRLVSDISGIVDLQLLGGRVNEIVLLTQQSQHAGTRHGLDTAHACGDGGLGNDLKETDLTRIVHVCMKRKKELKKLEKNNTQLI